MSDSKLHLDPFGRFVDQNRLEGLLIGGHAVNFHGYTRLTVDFDFLIRRRHLPEWSAALSRIGYSRGMEAPTFIRFAGPEDTPFLDLMLVNDSTYEKLAADAVSVGIANIRTVSAEHLIALKLHALAQDLDHRRLKDFLDIVEIVAAKHLDLKSPEMKAILERYGNTDLNRRILKMCDQDDGQDQRP